VIEVHFWSHSTNHDIIDKPATEIENYCRSEVLSNDNIVIHTYNENIVHMFRVLIVEGLLPVDDFKLYYDDVIEAHINEYGAYPNCPDECKYLFMSGILAERILRGAVKKRRASIRTLKEV
jgi:hypothetical protein